MVHFETGEYAVLLKTFMQAASYIKPNTDLGKQIQQVINILKKSNSNTAKPIGGSSSSCSCSSCKGEKVHGLLRMFSLDRT